MAYVQVQTIGQCNCDKPQIRIDSPLARVGVKNNITLARVDGEIKGKKCPNAKPYAPLGRDAEIMKKHIFSHLSMSSIKKQRYEVL